MVNPLKALLITKGHPFEQEPFFAAFETWPDIEVTAVEQPAAQTFFAPDLAAEWDAFVFYDMPGIEFRREGGVRFHDPPAAHRESFLALLEAGHGFVFLHHAIAGWTSWPESTGSPRETRPAAFPPGRRTMMNGSSSSSNR